jgi:hypothetical protein
MSGNKRSRTKGRKTHRGGVETGKATMERESVLRELASQKGLGERDNSKTAEAKDPKAEGRWAPVGGAQTSGKPGVNAQTELVKEQGSGIGENSSAALEFPRDYPFYASSEDTHRLDSLARYSVKLEEFKRLSSFCLGESDNKEHLSLAWISDKERFSWLPDSDLMRWLAVILANGDVAALERFSQAYKTYQEGWGDLSNKDLAKVHLMIACNTLWAEGYDRDKVTKVRLKTGALFLWAKYACRTKRRNLTPENLKREQQNLPHVDWPLIFREIGLSDIRAGKPGRKPIGNAKR